MNPQLPSQPTPCPICNFPLKLVNEPNRKIISCHNCGWLKNLITGRQLPGDPPAPSTHHPQCESQSTNHPPIPHRSKPPTMPTGYASWFENQYAKLSNQANSCTLC